MAIPKTFTAGERLFAADLNDNFDYFSGGTPSDGQVLTYNSTSGKWEAKDMKMKEKRVAAFTGDGTFTVPAGVTYAIAHMLGGGGGIGEAATGGDGGVSSVEFASGTVVSNGGPAGLSSARSNITYRAAAANTGRGAIGTLMSLSTGSSDGGFSAIAGQYAVAGAAVTPAEQIAVTVGAGGAAGTGGAAGGSGYVYIEYFEEA